MSRQPTALLEHGIWWHVYPLGALGAPIRQRHPDDGAHRLPALTGWLDHVVELGCTGLLLGPVFESATHGYDTLDHLRIDRRLGDEADVDAFLAECRRRGLSVLLDGVFNHVGVDHPWVRQTLDAGHGPVRLEGGRPRPWEGNGDLAELDHGDPRVVNLVTEVMLHWLRRGVAGWRLDVAYAVPATFWREVTGRVRTEFPDALFLGEVIHGDYPALIEAGGWDTATQYELWKAIWSSLADRNLWELAWALDRHREFSEHHVLNTFVGNHDVTRIASAVGPDAAALAAVLLFTLPGMPSVYAGDEYGWLGVKGNGAGADDPLRPALPAVPPPPGELYRLHQDLIGLRRRHPWLTRGSVQVTAKDNLWIEYRVSSGTHRLDVRLDLDPAPAARLTFDDGETLTSGSHH